MSLSHRVVIPEVLFGEKPYCAVKLTNNMQCPHAFHVHSLMSFCFSKVDIISHTPKSLVQRIYLKCKWLIKNAYLFKKFLMSIFKV